MKITIELTSVSEFEKIMAFLKSLGLPDITVSAPAKTKSLPPNWELGDKSLDPEALFGMWKDAPRDLQELRSSAWKRNWGNA
jgi:hypothetical protein